MQPILSKKAWLAVAMAAILGLHLATALAHEGREVGEYRFVVGWAEEPAYEGMKNGVDIRVTKVVKEGHGDHEDEDDHSMDKRGLKESDGYDDGQGDHDEGYGGEGSGPRPPKALASLLSQGGGQGHGKAVPVEGLEDTLQVEVIHTSTGESRVLDLRAVLDEPGYYTADLIPTAPGVYEFRVFGTVEDLQINESFLSRGGGGGFDDIRSSTGLQFPQKLAEVRELEGAIRGALTTAQQAQDAALAAQAASEGDGGSNTLPIVAIVIGVVGIVTGAAGLGVALRRR